MKNTTIKNFIVLIIISAIVSFFIVRAVYASTNIYIDNEVVYKETPKDCLSETKRIFNDKWIIAASVMLSEGNNNKNAYNKNNDKLKTHDRGCWQINSYWHEEVTDICAYDVTCSTEQAYRISKGGTDWSQWYGYKSTNYYRLFNKLSKL